jgi:regulation of enolase protein 1 (concanavalin A-like superfamily)
VRGDAAAFVETSPGAITMNGTGTDVWDAADQFRFAYKALKGNGSIIAKVASVSNSNEWAKAGVMIRESTAAGSTHAFLAVTPTATHGISYQRRVDTGVATNLATDVANTPVPQWVKVTRSGSTFTAQYSSDGKAWTDVAVSPAVSITMANDALIGLAVTSHAAGSVCAARFSNVSTTGGVSGAWQVAEIGVAQVGGNTPENFYLAVQDSARKTKVVSNPSSGVIATGGWEQWSIPLAEFTSAGLNLGSIKKMMIGIGDRNSPKAGGTGKVYIDDIRLTRQ